MILGGYTELGNESRGEIHSFSHPSVTIKKSGSVWCYYAFKTPANVFCQ